MDAPRYDPYAAPRSLGEAPLGRRRLPRWPARAFTWVALVHFGLALVAFGAFYTSSNIYGEVPAWLRLPCNLFIVLEQPLTVLKVLLMVTWLVLLRSGLRASGDRRLATWTVLAIVVGLLPHVVMMALRHELHSYMVLTLSDLIWIPYMTICLRNPPIPGLEPNDVVASS